MFILAVIPLIFILIVVSGVSFIQLNYFVKSIHKGTNKGVALTFDDGPDSIITSKILDILAQENVKASFFVIGHKLEGQKELLQRIYSEGHTIGNHSFSHTKKLTIASTSNLKENVLNCSAAIESIIHKKPLFFRPPFGITTPSYNRMLNHFKMKSIGWSLRSFDTTSKNKDLLYKKVVKRISHGSIILFHDTKKITLEILPDVIQYCRDNSIKIVPLPELINEQAYE